MGSGMAIQGATRHTVLELVRRDRARTRRDLSGLTGLSRSAVAQLVSELVAEGLLTEETGDHETRPGRPATRLSLVPRHGLVGAVDIGHGHLSAALGDLHENVLDVHRERFAVERSPRDAFRAARAVLDAMLARHGARRADLRTVGIGVPFPVVDREVAPVGDVPAWAGIRPAEALALSRDVPAVVGNASDLAGWAEYVASDDGVDSLLYVSAGEGVGGALVMNQAIFAGRHGFSGEIGHVVVPGCELRCRCGRIGCLDALVSAAARAEATRDERLAAADAVGTVMAGLAGFVDPDVVVLGGALGGADVEFARTVAASYHRHGPFHHARFRPARLGPHAPLWGALDRATQDAWSHD